MRKILWLGLAVLALLLAGIAWTASEPVGPSIASPMSAWAPWFLLASLGAIALLAFRALARRQAQASTAAPGASSVGLDAVPAPAPPPQLAPLHIMEAAVATVAGCDAAMVLQTLCETPPLPEPDPELPDANGMPRLSARCRDLDPAAVASALPAQAPPLRPAVLRALALQAMALEGLQPSLSQEAPDIDLDILWMVPAHWSEQERAQATAWLQSALSSCRPESSPAPRIHVLGASTPATMLQRLRVHASALRTGSTRTGRAIALACDSRLDEALPATASHAASQLPPGEAAAALVLWRPSPEVPSAPPESGSPAILVRLVTPGKGAAQDTATGTGLRELAARALDDPVTCEQIGWAISDVSLSGQPAREVLDSLVERLPHLDVGERLCRLGVACGDLGAAGPSSPPPCCCCPAASRRRPS
jgi:hypothetical protein